MLILSSFRYFLVKYMTQLSGLHLCQYFLFMYVLQSSYHKFNEARRSRFVIERLRHGGALALISDAGMPGVSDPGAELVMFPVWSGNQLYRKNWRTL